MLVSRCGVHFKQWMLYDNFSQPRYPVISAYQTATIHLALTLAQIKQHQTEIGGRGQHKRLPQAANTLAPTLSMFTYCKDMKGTAKLNGVACMEAYGSLKIIGNMAAYEHSIEYIRLPNVLI